MSSSGKLRGLIGLVLLVVAAAAGGCGRGSTPVVTAKGPAAAGASRQASPEAPAETSPVRAEKATVPESEPVFRVEIVPSMASLSLVDAGSQFQAIQHSSEGTIEDLTAQVRWEVEPAGVAAVDAQGYVSPLQPGEAEVRATTAGGQVLISRVLVTGELGAERAWDFAEDVVPLFTRYGCNTGGCHGRALGQADFHLSLFGYDALGDYEAITRRASMRRIDPFQPERSLILLKATGKVPHGGGVRFSSRDPAYQVIKSWVASGSPFQAGETPGRVEKVTVEPSPIALENPGDVALRVLAHYEKGQTRDVTRLALYQTKDDSVASVDNQGKASLLKRGETDLVVRYQSFVVPARLTTVINPVLDFDFSAVPRKNVVDDELFRRLEALRVPVSPEVDDAGYLRRLTLDLTGQLPTPDEVRAFLSNASPSKRESKIDELMERREFKKFWGIKLGDLLQITTDRFPNSAGYYQMWLENQLNANVPWDQMVRELLTALGNPNSREGGAANYALDGPDAQTRAEQTAQRFLGLRFRCAQCHDHPFDVWTQNQYYGLAAFFAKAELGGGARMMAGGMMSERPEVGLNPAGNVLHKRTGQVVKPSIPGGTTPEIAADADPRAALADWMTRPGNPYFARALANWTWAQLFGRGLCEPADDLSASNPPVHPALLEALARAFEEQKYDIRALIRLIASSHAYELSGKPVSGNEGDRRLFSRHLPRPLSAHQMADALAQATDVPNLYPDRAKGTKAIEVFDPAAESTILDTFGRCPRTIACSSVGSAPVTLRQSLLLIGGDVVNSKVASLNGYLANLMEFRSEPGDIVENLYLRTLCRLPSAEEQALWTAELKDAPSLRETAEDLFWALLNSREFCFNN